MNKTSILAIALSAIVLLGSGGVYATGQIARSNAMSESDAINFAYVDAGVSPDDATVTYIEFDYERGNFVYDIEFIAKGIEYDYTIDSNSGKILERSQEVKYAWVEPQGGDGTTGQNTNGTSSGTNSGTSGQSTGTSDVNAALAMEEAKSIALKRAGVSEGDVIFEKAKLEKDDGVLIYDIEFYVPNVCEYDFEIDANDGSIREESQESLEIPVISGGNDSSSSSNSGESASPSSSASGENASSGDMTIEQKGESSSIKAATSSGEIDITAEKTASVETAASSGDITLRLESMPDDVTAATSSGNIKVCVPEDVGFTAKAATASGDFDSDLTLTKEGSRYVYGNGKCEMELAASSGDICITYR